MHVRNMNNLYKDTHDTCLLSQGSQATFMSLKMGTRVHECTYVRYKALSDEVCVVFEIHTHKKRAIIKLF